MDPMGGLAPSPEEEKKMAAKQMKKGMKVKKAR